jgi:hypothetical protein
MTPREQAVIDLARKIADYDGRALEAQPKPFASAHMCDTDETILVTCKCGEKIKVEHHCETMIEAEEFCSDFEGVQDPDLDLLLRELDLALVSLDLENARGAA